MCELEYLLTPLIQKKKKKTYLDLPQNFHKMCHF